MLLLMDTETGYPKNCDKCDIKTRLCIFFLQYSVDISNQGLGCQSRKI